KTPVERLVRRLLVFASKEGQQVCAIEFPFRLDFQPGCGQRCGVNVELDDRTIIDFSRWKMAFPLHNPRHTDATFPRLRFETAERTVAGGGAGGWPAVIADEKDQSVL